MNSLPALYHACAARGPVVLGLRLRTITVGHTLLLHRLESPVARGGQFTIGELLLAAYVLSRPWEKAAESLRSPFRRLRFWALTKYVLPECDIQKDHAALMSWVSDRDDSLSVLRDNGDGKALEAPGIERLLLTLCRCGLTADDSLDLPMQDAERIALCWAEANGNVELSGSNHAAAKAHAERERERVMAEWQSSRERVAQALAHGVDPSTIKGN